MRLVVLALSIVVGVEALSASASASIRHKAFRPARPCATCPRVAVNYLQMAAPLRLAVRSTEHQFKEGLVATPAVGFGLVRPRVFIVVALLALVSAVLVVLRRKSGGEAPDVVYDDERAPPAAPPSAPPPPPAPTAEPSTAWTQRR